MAEVVKGLAKTLKALDALGKDLDQEIDLLVFENAKHIERVAKSLAPRDEGILSKTIVTGKIADRTYKVTAVAPYAAYMEFGTGPQARVPAELAAQAAAFKGMKGGSFQAGLDSIKNWCRRNGIEESAAYPIFMSILKKGLRPRPFLYPAFLAQRRELLQGLEKILERETKKI